MFLSPLRPHSQPRVGSHMPFVSTFLCVSYPLHHVNKQGLPGYGDTEVRITGNTLRWEVPPMFSRHLALRIQSKQNILVS
jgi:hypothetical protein